MPQLARRLLDCEGFVAGTLWDVDDSDACVGENLSFAVARVLKGFERVIVFGLRCADIPILVIGVCYIESRISSGLCVVLAIFEGWFEIPGCFWKGPLFW